MDSPLYQSLVGDGYLIPHQEVDRDIGKDKDKDKDVDVDVDVDVDMRGEGWKIYRIIKPERVPFISYPHEWCFLQLKDAALTTLEIQERALAHGMSLKDASAFNIQFFKGRPLLIDTLSFEEYREGEPWIAYQQFCAHFLAPLSLMAYKDVRLNRLFLSSLEGIHLDLASSLLPKKTYLSFPLLAHIHLHARSQRHLQRRREWRKGVSLQGLKGLLDHLKRGVERLKIRESSSFWSNYYEENTYTKKASLAKKEIVSAYLEKSSVERAWDLGANTGVFSSICREKGIETIAFDLDPMCIERIYKKEREHGMVLPLCMDLTNPTPAYGWNHKERLSLVKRGPTDLVLFLALLHHLVIGHNLSFRKIFSFLSQITSTLIIEYIPKDDEQVRLLLERREDIFPWYRREVFEEVSQEYFQILEKREIINSGRILYRMKREDLL